MNWKFILSILLLLAGVLMSMGAVIGPEQPSAQDQPTLVPPGTPIIVPGTPIIVVPTSGDGTMTQTLILFGILALIVVVVLLVVYLSMSRSNTPPGPPPP